MATNTDVINGFFWGVTLKSGSLTTQLYKKGGVRFYDESLEGGVLLYSYNTIVAIKKGKWLFVDKNKYSTTTSKHINFILNHDDVKWLRVFEVDKISCFDNLEDLFNKAFKEVILKIEGYELALEKTKNSKKIDQIRLLKTTYIHKKEYLQECLNKLNKNS